MVSIPEGCGQFTLFFGGPAMPRGGVVTIGFTNDADQSAAGCVADFVTAFTASGIMANLSSAIETTKARAKLGPDDTGPFAEQAMSIGGGGAATAVSPQVSFLVRKQTTHGGRKGRGRFYLPGVLEADVGSGGLVAPLVVSALQADVETLRTGMEGLDIPPALLHDDLVTGAYPITGFVVDPTVATQRRRLRG